MDYHYCTACPGQPQVVLIHHGTELSCGHSAVNVYTYSEDI
jgi:hypothetical protein